MRFEIRILRNRLGLFPKIILVLFTVIKKNVNINMVTEGINFT